MIGLVILIIRLYFLAAFARRSSSSGGTSSMWVPIPPKISARILHTGAAITVKLICRLFYRCGSGLQRALVRLRQRHLPTHKASTNDLCLHETSGKNPFQSLQTNRQLKQKTSEYSTALRLPPRLLQSRWRIFYWSCNMIETWVAVKRR